MYLYEYMYKKKRIIPRRFLSGCCALSRLNSPLTYPLFFTKAEILVHERNQGGFPKYVKLDRHYKLQSQRHA